MPIYCEILQLVLPKTIVESKYKGGLEQFKIDFKWGKKVDHEDNELISVASMGNSFLNPKGLHYDDKSDTSKDFVIAARYGTPVLSWEVDWCESDRVYIWHKDCKLSSYKKMKKHCTTPMNEVVQFSKETGKAFYIDFY